jgi:YesN/AraC family two-component response regulator
MKSDINILIVEDDIITSMYWAASLREPQYSSIRTTTSGENAIELSKSENPDIVIMDIHLMGKLDGIETAIEINSFCDSYFIFSTCYPDDDFLRKIGTIKSADYLIKPIMVKDIHNLIKKRNITERN